MNIAQIARFGTVVLLLLVAGGCASQKEEKKGHWVTLPPVTGSMVERKVWVDDSGNVGSVPGTGNVQSSGSSSLEKTQTRGGSIRRIGE